MTKNSTNDEKRWISDWRVILSFFVGTIILGSILIIIGLFINVEIAFDFGIKVNHYKLMNSPVIDQGFYEHFIEITDVAKGVGDPLPEWFYQTLFTDEGFDNYVIIVKTTMSGFWFFMIAIIIGIYLFILVIDDLDRLIFKKSEKRREKKDNKKEEKLLELDRVKGINKLALFNLVC